MTADVLDDDGADAYVAARPKLMGIAYRMLGSVAEAEDVVGDVALRWAGADRAGVEVPEAWLVTATTRRALDVATSARLQRNEYPGVWLPEPVATGPGPGEALEQAESLTMGFLLLLERLTPIERAVLVMHDALGYDYASVAEAVGRSEASCRQAARRARRHVTVPPRRSGDLEQAQAVARRFLVAASGGDVEALMESLAPDVVVLSDGGGVVHAAMRPVSGPRQVARLVSNLARRIADGLQVFPLELNGAAGACATGGGIWVALVVEPRGDQVGTVYAVVNPDKLERLVATIPAAAALPGPASTSGRFRHRGGRRLLPES